MTVATQSSGHPGENVNGSDTHGSSTHGSTSHSTGAQASGPRDVGGSGPLPSQHHPRPPESDRGPIDSGTGEEDDDDLLTYLSVDGELLPGRVAPMSDEEAARLFASMITIRLVDERMVMLQRQGRIGFYIGGSGEEATIIGSAAAMQENDWLFPCYRENGAYLLLGLPFQRFLDNLFGNTDDPIRGRQMPNHIAWRERNITSVSSPIGTQIAQAAGAGYAAKLQGKPDVMLTYFGEGATSSNDFHTGLNFAGVWKAPVVFVCRNNHWAISVPSSKQTAAKHFADKAIGYGMPGIRVDGNDLFAMYAATRDAFARARRGDGPTMIEAVTYRLSGHSTSDDPRVYRPEEQVEPWRPKEPLLRLRRYLTARGQWSPEREEALKARVEDDCRAAIARAEAAEPPPLDSLFADVFAQLPWHLKEQRDEVRRLGRTFHGHGSKSK